ncbi:MAG TPA: alpha/beta fold hydrolase [Caulobacteraceae bacterium]|nr:alpha/beta fold hydrolase [Caulobacteraceae bacterium]
MSIDMHISSVSGAPGPNRRPRARLSAGLRRFDARPALGLLFCFALGAIALMATPLDGSASLRPRGQMVDIGGRRLRIVCEGPAHSTAPTVLFESGAYGFSGDWAYSQHDLTLQGVRSCAYDRAGMGLSDAAPASEPRDGVNVARDLEKLLVAAHVPAPYILVGHSMAGARVHLFANRNPDKVVGLVLVDSTTPDAMSDPQVMKYVTDFTHDTHMAKVTAQFGILKLLAGTPLGDKVGLPPEEDKEKRAQFASASYNRTAYEEVTYWPLAARQAAATGPLNTDLPVAVVSAGVFDTPEGPRQQALEPPPARASRDGHVEVVAGASHNGLLGATYHTAIVRGVDFVLNSVRTHPPQPARPAATPMQFASR